MQTSLIHCIKRLHPAILQQLPRQTVLTTTRAMSSISDYKFETLKVTVPKEFVYQVEINRPEKRNAMNPAFWSEMVVCFAKINIDPECRAVVFTGAGKMFTAGLDLQGFAGTLMQQNEKDVGRKAFHLRSVIPALQDSFTVIEKCTKPVIAAVHGACIGGGVDLITAADIRYCTQDAYFQVKEVDLGIVADVGTLQRLPKIVGNDSLVRELCYTARQMLSDEAKEAGLVSRVFPDRNAMVDGAIQTASLIASKSPIAVQGTKIALVYSRDHSVADSLDQVVTMNQGLLQSEDVITAAQAFMTKQPATFSKL